MGGPPSHIFLVRHGNRLDAADKQWHLSSPTPYDTPITYSGFLQARAVGNQIINLLEQTKLEEEVRNGETRRKRFKVIIHTSPFLRCVQTSVGISSGLAQTTHDSIYKSSDIIVPPFTPAGKSPAHRTALLRIDSFLGEWLSPEYFELITPPPGPALMLGGAKAELLRREDYSMYTETTADEQPAPRLSRSLWQGSPSASPTVTPLPNSESEGALNVSSLAAALPVERRKGYAPPRPIQPAQGSGKIPEGFVAHARDACTTVDYQWDSMREPLDFGDGGKFGEEWAAMHKRFRLGLRKLVNWYAANETADNMVTSVGATESCPNESDSVGKEEDVETVLVLVSHGAGCNALMGAITHQPVLMDVATASLSMAVTKPDLDYKKLLATAKATDPSVDYVTVDQMYQMRMSASTEHLQSTSSTPLSGRSGRSASTANGTRPLPSSRGRTATFTNSGTVIGPFVATDYFSLASRSISASATGPPPTLRKEASERSLRGASETSDSVSQTTSNGERPTSSGLWAPSTPSQSTSEPAPAPVTAESIFASSALKKQNSLFSDNNEDKHAFGGGMFPDFDNARFQPAAPSKPTEPAPPAPFFTFGGSLVPSATFPSSPMLAGPIRVQTDLADDVVVEEVSVTPLGNGLGGFWGQPPPASETEPIRDMSHTKRRWTMNESV